MGWEKRGNKKYYYRKKRIGKKVVSEYIGTGPSAEKIAREDELARRKREIERETRKRWIDKMDALDQELDLFSSFIQTLIDAHLQNAGYHNHRGEWRKKRDN